MFYFFSKTATYLLTPAGWLVTALIFAFFVKRARLRRQFIGLALGIFWLFGNSFLVNELALWWEYPIKSDIAAPKDSVKRVAIVLTGGIINGDREAPGTPLNRTHLARFLLGREADRIGQALYLYKTGAVQKVLISGGLGSWPFQPISLNDEGHLAGELLIIAGVRPEDIVLEGKSRNTHENAQFSAPILRKRFDKTHYEYVLITSAWHMKRAIACFQKEGIQTTPFPSNFLGNRRLFGPSEWLLPDEEAFFESYYLIREFVGYVTYKLVGYA
ncbi:YdcF family protein [Spirosoma fluviale]|uniref:Uncharacterized SAM-binding protein YcdF, DUF218 family n=1 Tax=Spirosoma fluviale TaxID=1597977 RepID=A0A286GAK7_9BACT|nr:YdcF family protein [Spirosoma fluviale]SOD92296.1 Uncharacterized SAM-binding protein YcdF, DUF218 family [Spirosoma fluviale]